MTKIIGISDTHCRLRKIDVPEGDLLLHAGDLTFRGDIQEISQELRELGRIAKNFKDGCVLVPGNHDWLFERNMSLAKQMCEDVGVTVLHQESVQIQGLNIFGSAFSPEFCNWAFNVPRGQALKEKWAQIPDNTDILITHGPPMGILDGVNRYNHSIGEWEIENVGCADLYNRIQRLDRLKAHFFGHIHCGYGSLKRGNVEFFNASICTEEYKPLNKPLTVEL
jgi:Icc-related predicted phosphoesterase